MGRCAKIYFVKIFIICALALDLEGEMRIPLIVGNWKMNTTVSEAVKLVNDMRPLLEPVNNIEKVVCPPFVSLSAVRDALKGSSVKVGAQNMYYKEKGAFTGEVSPLMLSDLCEYVILGHSERRQYFGETNEVVNKKIQAALEVGLKPILCVGESLAQYEAGKTETIVTEQVTDSLRDIPESNNLVIAYEPVWAIGTGKAATGVQANKIIGMVRKIVTNLYDNIFAQNLCILYGGSVTGDNINEFIGQPEIDGGLIGGASLKVDQFVNIVKKTAQIK
jgi:triosephosphate isomerase